MGEVLATGAAKANPIDLAVVGVYVVFMIVGGGVFARYMKSARDLFAAGGNAPWWVAGISSYMTFFSAGTFVVWGSLAYIFGWLGITIQWAIAVGQLVVTVFLARRWKRVGIDSPVQFLEERFNFSVRQLYVWGRLPFAVLMSAQAVYSISVLAHDQIGSGYSLNTVIAVMTAVVVIYTVLGGLWAVLTTDVLQFFVVTLVTFMALPLALREVGGLGAFIDNAPAGFFQLAQDASDYAEPQKVNYTWHYFFAWVVFQIFLIGAWWEIIQRFQSCRSEKDARRSGYLIVVCYTIMPLFWLGPLMIYRVIDPSYYDPADPLATKQAEAVYTAMCRRLFPVGLTGLALAAMISATGSMVNSALNVMSAVVTRDFYARLLRKSASEKELLLAGRAAIIVFGILVTFMACRIQGWGGVVKYLFIILNILAGPVAVPFVWSIISRRTSAAAVWLAVLGGVGVSAAIEFVCPRYELQFTLAGKQLASTLVPLGILIISSAVTRPGLEKRQAVDAFFRRMNTPLTTIPHKHAAYYGPIGLIGVLTAVLGAAILQLVWLVQEQRLLISVFSLVMVVFGVSLKVVCRRRSREAPGIVQD